MTDAALLPIADLDAADRRAMRDLLNLHFLGVTAESFDRDLADKTHALLLHRNDRLVGFSTLAHYYELGNAVICSGDTIMDPSAWASPDLPRQWIRAVRTLEPEGCFWLLLCGGFRTYRLLSTFWRTFVPRHCDVDETLLAWRDLHAAERFGDRFNPATGVVKVRHPTPLRPHLADIPAGRLNDPHVAFFAAANPGHGRGDELACLCDLGDDNLTRAGRRMVGGGT